MMLMLCRWQRRPSAWKKCCAVIFLMDISTMERYAAGENRIYGGSAGKVKGMFAEMHKYYGQRYTPKVKWSKSCNACSLKDICLPVLNKNISVKSYLDNRIKEEGPD